MRDVEDLNAEHPHLADGGHVLIIDDEPVLAAAMARHLGTRFDVQLAHDGPEALRALEFTDFDLVLCDVRLPGVSGMELFETAILTRPGLAGCFVFVTGDPLDEALREFVARHRIRVLEKPFDASDLDRIVERPANRG